MTAPIRPRRRDDEDPLARLEQRAGLGPLTEDDSSDALSALERKHGLDSIRPDTGDIDLRESKPTPATQSARPPVRAIARRVVPPAAVTDMVRVQPRAPLDPNAPLSLPERAAGHVIGFGKAVATDPLGTAASIVTDPLRSAERTFLRPVEGERVSGRYGKAGPLPGQSPPGTTITRENTPSAITSREFGEAAAQTVANVAAAPLGAGVSRVARPVLGRLGSTVAGAAAGGAPVGAAYTPDDPLAGALAVSAIAGAVPLAGEAARKPARSVASAIERGARGGAELAAQASERVRGLFERGEQPDALSALEEQHGVEPSPLAPGRTPNVPATLRELRRMREMFQRLAESEAAAPDVREGYRSTIADIDRQISEVNAGRLRGDVYTPPPTGGVEIVRVPTADIQFKPDAFQYKRGGDAETGAGAELTAVTRFDESLAGVVSLWRDPADGRLYAVNGHNRVALAKRTAHPSLNAQILPAETAAEARAMGAIANIAEGRGTAVDAAQFFRDSGLGPDDLKERVSFKGAIARRGAALAKLAPDLFDRVVRGDLAEGYAAAIGDMLDTPELQRTATSVVEASGKRLTDSEVAEVARQVRDAGSETVQQETLFGTEIDQRPLYVERAQLAEAIKKKLGADRRTFGYVSREGRADELARGGNVIDVETSRRIAEESAQVGDVFATLYTRAGPIADALTEGARRVARGEKPAAVAADLYPVIREAVQTTLAGGERAGHSTPRVGDPERQPAPGHETARGSDAADVQPEAEGPVRDSTDPDQQGFLSPRRRWDPLADLEAQHGLDDALLSPDLFGNEEPPRQASLFGEREGTPESRSLRAQETAARAELDRLRQIARLERDPARSRSIAQRIATLERLVNRDRAITAEEMATRARAEGDTDVPPLGLDQASLFSPAVRRTPLGARVRQALGLKAPTGDVLSLGKISRDMMKALDLPFSQGRFNAAARRAVGVFFPHAETTRVVRYDRLDTAAHEAGHYISKRYLRNPTMRGAQARGALKPSPAALRELIQMGRDLYGSRKPAGGYGEEGIAEWVSFYVTEPATLATKAPEFTKFMDQVFQNEPALRDVLTEAQERFKDYTAASANQRADALISVGERTRNMPTATTIIRAALDDLQPIKEAAEALGRSTDPRQDAYVLSRLTRGAAGAAEEMAARGVMNFHTGERVTQGFAQVLESIRPERMQAFRRYLLAERTLEAAGRDVDTGLSISDAIDIVNATRAEFAAPAQAVWDISQALIDYRRDAGLLTPEEATTIKHANQRRVGLYRVFEPEETAASKGTGRQMARNSSGLQRLKGSARPIVDPLESVITDIYKTVQQANNHHAATTLLRLALDTEGGGRIAERVPAPKRPVTIPIDRVKGQLRDLGIDIPDSMMLDELPGVLTSFEDVKIAGPNEAKDLVVPILEDGQRVWVKIQDKQLYETLQGLGTPEMTPLMRTLSFPTRLLRAGATLTTEFIARNPIRDAWSAAIYGRAGFRPPGWDLTRGLFHALSHDGVYQRWKLEGGDNATMLGLDRPTVQRQLREFTASKGKRAADVVLHPIDTLRMVSSLMENASRLGEFAAVERQALGRMGVTYDTATPAQRRAAGAEAGYASRDVTIDFARSGAAARHVNQLVAFFNANLQGTDKLVRELRERPHVVVPRALAAVTLPSLALYYLQKDDPAYQEIPRWQKDVFWIVIDRNENGGLEHVWRIPKPFELGVLFGTVPERIAEYIDREDPDAFNELGARLTDTFVPPVIPTVLTPLVENFANRSLFTNRSIVPPSVQRLEPAEQTTARTGELARLLGQATNYPPAKIDNTIRGYTGGLGGYATGLVDALIRGGRGAFGMPPLGEESRDLRSPLERTPLVRGFVAGAPGMNGESVQRIYQEFDRAEARRLTLARIKDPKEADAYFARHRDEIESVMTARENGGTSGWLREAYTRLTKLNRERSGLRTSTGPLDSLRARERAIEDEMINTSRAYLGRQP